MCGRFLLGSRNASWPKLDSLHPRGNYLDSDGNVERTESATMASEEIMDLRKTVPRSPKDKMLGLVSLKRTIDKAKAHNEGHLGEYDYDCPHDRPLFEFLGTNGDEFARKVQELDSDQAIAEWIQREHLRKKTPADIERFNEERMRWHPDPAHQGHYDDLRKSVAPERDDVSTWFDLLDLDEHRPVPVATAA